MNKSSFFIIGQHAVIEALRNPKRKVLRIFLTEDSKKNSNISVDSLRKINLFIEIINLINIQQYLLNISKK